ncbi:MAG TPA: L-lactate permease [Limnochordales bacterium]
MQLTGLPDAAGRWLRSPALWLPVTAAITLWFGVASGRRSVALAAATAAYHRWKGVAAATLVFLALGVLMTHSGMAATLAAGATRIGGAYILLAPWIGGLGGFLTGSNTGANAMFAAAQAAAAEQLGLPVLALLAIQNVAASLLTMVSGPRVALARSLLDPGEPWQALVRWVPAANLLILCTWSLWAAFT